MTTLLFPRRSALASTLLLFSAVLLATASTARAENVTYSLVNDMADQNGWSLTGSITTDGTLGWIGTQNVLNWSYTITNGTQAYSAGETSGYLAAGTLYATAGDLGLFGPGNPSDWNLRSPGDMNDPTFSVVGWDASAYLAEVGGWGQNLLWESGGSGIVASIPEPSTLVLFGIAALGLLGYARRRVAWSYDRGNHFQGTS